MEIITLLQIGKDKIIIFEKIGTGLTESSGTFSFPSTGKYLIIYNGQASGNGDAFIGIKSYLTTYNSSYNAYK